MPSPSDAVDTLKAELTKASRTFVASKNKRDAVVEATSAVMDYLRTLNCRTELLAPFEAVLSAAHDADCGRPNPLFKSVASSGGQRMKVQDALNWASAAAAITILKDEARMPLTDAIREAANAIGEDANKLKHFRKNLMKGNAPADAIEQYEFALSTARTFKADLTPEQRGRLCLRVPRAWKKGY